MFAVRNPRPFTSLLGMGSLHSSKLDLSSKLALSSKHEPPNSNTLLKFGLNAPFKFGSQVSNSTNKFRNQISHSEVELQTRRASFGSAFRSRPVPHPPSTRPDFHTSVCKRSTHPAHAPFQIPPSTSVASFTNAGARACVRLYFGVPSKPMFPKADFCSGPIIVDPIRP